MPEIVGYGPVSASGASDKRINIGDKNVVNRISRVDPVKGSELQASEQMRISDGIKRARSGGNASLSSRGDLGQPQSLSTARTFELRLGPGAREEGAGPPRGSGGPLGGPSGPAALGVDSIGASGGLREPAGVGAFQRVIEDNVPDDLQSERVADASRFAERVDRSIDTLNKRMEDLGRSVRFSKDREFDREVITVVNPDSGDIVRQIPPEYAIRISEGLKSLRGMLFDDKA